MKICITSPIFPPDLGGPSTCVPSFASYLHARGHDVTVVAFCSDPNPQGWPFRIYSIPRRWLPLRYLISFFRTWREASKADVLYINEHLALAVVLAGRLRRRPMVIRVCVDGPWEITRRYGLHNDSIVDFLGKKYGFTVWFARRMQVLWWSWVDAIVAPSQFLKKIVEGYGVSSQKIHYIPNTYHVAGGPVQSAADARKQLGIDPRVRVVLTIARLEIWKGVDGLIRAIAQLPDLYELYIAGDGEEYDNWSKLAKDMGVADRVHFLGNVDYAMIPAWIRACDVFTLNSRYEGMSHAILEVMWIGAPAAVSNAGGNPELITHGVNGLTFDYHDIPAIVSSIQTLCENRDMAARYVEASRTKIGEFKRETVFGSLENLLQRVARRER